MKQALLLALVAVPCSAAVLAVAQAPTAEDDDAARRAKVYARFDDVTITVGDIEDRIRAQSTFQSGRYEEPERLRALVDDMMQFALLAHEAERRGYTARGAVERAYEEALVQRFIREEFDERFDRAEVSDEDVAAYYEAHREQFVVPDQVRASHILVDTEAEARQLIDELRGADLRKLRQLAIEHSLDTETKLSGGDLRFFTREGVAAGTHGTPVHPAIVEAAFSLHQRGEVYSEPVPVDGKLSVVVLTALRPGENRTIEEVAPTLRRRINRDRRREALDHLVHVLRERVPVTSYPERLRAIVLDPPPAAPAMPKHGGGRGDPRSPLRSDSPPRPGR